MKYFESNKLYFSQVDMHKDFTMPSKEDEDAGFDIYASFEMDNIIIPSRCIRKIPTNLASAFDKKYVAIIKERGSTGKIGMTIRCGVIDSGYRGEWFISILNPMNYDICISKEVEEVSIEGGMMMYPYSKAICQVVMQEVPELEVRYKKYEDLLAIESERGIGKEGSSGK